MVVGILIFGGLELFDDVLDRVSYALQDAGVWQEHLSGSLLWNKFFASGLEREGGPLSVDLVLALAEVMDE